MKKKKKERWKDNKKSFLERGHGQEEGKNKQSTNS